MKINEPRRRPVPTAERFADGLLHDHIDNDASVAQWIARLLSEIPSPLAASSGPWPHLRALQTHDDPRGAELARQLLIVAALVHRDADERRTAEYLLRHRHELEIGRRNAVSLVRAARCAAHMDVRRVGLRETPTSADVLVLRAEQPHPGQRDEPSVAEFTVQYLADAISPCVIDASLQRRIGEATRVALAVAERHHRNGGSGPSVIAMRTDARPEARLVTHLRRAFGDAALARSLARLLVGGDGTAIDTGLLWWAAHPEPAPPSATTLRRWFRDLTAADRLAVSDVA